MNCLDQVMNTNRKRSNSTLASLQHLCSLGLPSEAVMPDLLQGLSAWMSADNGQCAWVDAALNPRHFYCNADELAFMQTFSARVEHLAVPGQESYKSFLLKDISMVQGGPDAKEYYRSSYYNEVMRACGGECTLAVPIRDPAGVPRASIGLNRDRRSHPFTALERRRYEQFVSHLSLLFSTPPDPAAMASERIGERGMAVCDYAGKFLYGDETARQLLFLAGHPKLARASGTREDASVESRIRRTCAALQDIVNGVPAAPPTFSLATPWGRIVFRARRLSSFTAGNDQAIGMEIVRYIPRRIAIWRQIRMLDLSPRLRQVCLEFAENRSLSDIAALLGISRHTVIDHVNKIYERCGLEPGRENLQEYLLHREDQNI
jgi:biotin operon repressor